MNKAALLFGILCIVVAGVVFVFADGLRRWYSGILFAILGIVMAVKAIRWHRNT